jgi:hypothetical protein
VRADLAFALCIVVACSRAGAIARSGVEVLFRSCAEAPSRVNAAKPNINNASRETGKAMRLFFIVMF